MTAAEIRKQNEDLRKKQIAMADAQRNGANQAQLARIATGAATTPVKATNKAAQAQAAVQNMATPNIYQQTLAAADPAFSTVNYDNVLKRGVDEGFRVANDEDKALWQQVIAAQNAGDTAAVTNLLNSMRAQGNFSGYYGDDGLYYGFARGYGGAAGNSYQPVIGGKLIASGNTDTDQWLTPDGKAYSGNLGGSLSSAGVWSYGDPKQMASVPSTKNYGTTKVPSGNGVDSAPASYSPEGGKIAQTIRPVESAPQSPGNAGAASRTAAEAEPTSAQRPQTPEIPQAPQAYDPDADPLWQRYLAEYRDREAPAWNGEFDSAAVPEYRAYLERYEQEQAPEYNGSEYQALRDEHTRRAEQPFRYDPERDPAWQAYRKQYRREGQRAYQDTLANAAARTGGKASSYAVTAANQAGNYYNAQLSDKIPQLYNEAYQRYLNEYRKQLGLAEAYDSYGKQDYDRYRDALEQWNTDRSFRYGAAQDAIGNRRSDYAQRYRQYQDRLGQFNTDRSFAYGAARDSQALGRQAVEDRYSRHRDAVGDQRYADETAYSRYRDAVADRRYDQEWAQQLREYADAQSWKARDWEQYLREYGDKMSAADREWAYQQYRDAVSDERYADETGYKRAWNEDERDYDREQTAMDRERQAMLDRYDREDAEYGRALNEAKLGASYGDWSGLRELGIEPDSGNVYRLALAEAGRTTPVGSSGYRSGSGGGGEQNSYSTSTVNAAYRAYLNGDRTDLTLRILDSAGLLGELTGAGDSSLGRMDEVLGQMQEKGMPWTWLESELDAEYRDGKLSSAQYQGLREKYLSRGFDDGIANQDGVVHRDGSPMSEGFSQVWRTVRDLADRQEKEKALAAMEKAAADGRIHEYEIDVMMDQLGW